jgi:hypothetical protein
LPPTNPQWSRRGPASFRDGPTSNDVQTLISEVEAASLSSNEAAERARERALDPVFPAKEVAEACRQMEDAAFARDRLSAAVPRLQGRREELLEAEEQARRWIAYEKVKAERDKLAAELADVYPAVEHKLADLLARIDANDRQIEHINERALPAGVRRLVVAELVARGLPSFTPKWSCRHGHDHGPRALC